MTRYLLQITAIVLVSIYAWRKGGKPERIGAGILCSLAAADPLYHAISPVESTYVTTDGWHLALDSAALVAAIALALRSDRFWPLWFAAMQLISTAAHLLRALDYTMDPLAYAIMTRGPSYPMILCLLVGVANYHLRSRRIAGLPSLRSSFAGLAWRVTGRSRRE